MIHRGGFLGKVRIAVVDASDFAVGVIQEARYDESRDAEARALGRHRSPQIMDGPAGEGRQFLILVFLPRFCYRFIEERFGA